MNFLNRSSASHFLRVHNFLKICTCFSTQTHFPQPTVIHGSILNHKILRKGTFFPIPKTQHKGFLNIVKEPFTAESKEDDLGEVSVTSILHDTGEGTNDLCTMLETQGTVKRGECLHFKLSMKFTSSWRS